MSRSRKKHGWVVDDSGKKFGKRKANKTVRRTEDVPNGKAYRKLYESYNISDYKFDARQPGEDDEWYRDWMK